MSLVVIALPSVVFAQFTSTTRLVDRIGDLIEDLIPIVIAIALLVFFWGLAKFIIKAGDETEVKSGRRLMMWGTVALFVIITIWGLIEFIGQELGVTPTQLQNIPSIPRP